MGSSEERRSRWRRRSFVLVLWEEAGAFPRSPPVWRIGLEDVATSRRYGFGSVAELARFLEQWMAHPPSPSAGDPRSPW